MAHTRTRRLRSIAPPACERLGAEQPHLRSTRDDGVRGATESVFFGVGRPRAAALPGNQVTTAARAVRSAAAPRRPGRRRRRIASPRVSSRRRSRATCRPGRAASQTSGGSGSDPAREDDAPQTTHEARPVRIGRVHQLTARTPRNHPHRRDRRRAERHEQSRQRGAPPRVGRARRWVGVRRAPTVPAETGTARAGRGGGGHTRSLVAALLHGRSARSRARTPEKTRPVTNWRRGRRAATRVRGRAACARAPPPCAPRRARESCARRSRPDDDSAAFVTTHRRYAARVSSCESLVPARAQRSPASSRLSGRSPHQCCRLTQRDASMVAAVELATWARAQSR